MLERLAVGAVFRRRPTNLFVGGLDSVMEADKPTATFHLRLELGEMREGGVVSSAVRVDEDGVGVVDEVLGRPLAVEADLHVDLVGSAFLQALCEELDAGVVFVLAWAVARASSDEEDVAFCVGCVRGGTEQGEGAEGQMSEWESGRVHWVVIRVWFSNKKGRTSG